MTKFCKTHAPDRTDSELIERAVELSLRNVVDPLGPGLKAEYDNSLFELSKRENHSANVLTVWRRRAETLAHRAEESQYMHPKLLDLLDEAQQYLENHGENPVRMCEVCQVKTTQAPDGICDGCLEESRASSLGLPTEELDGRPIDIPEDPEDALILQAVIAEGDRREEDDSRMREMAGLHGDTAYLLGWRDCEAYFRQLANGSTFEVQVIETLTEED